MQATTLQDYLRGYRLSLHQSKSGAAVTVRGQLLDIKVARSMRSYWSETKAVRYYEIAKFLLFLMQ